MTYNYFEVRVLSYGGVALRCLSGGYWLSHNFNFRRNFARSGMSNNIADCFVLV